MKLRTKFGIAVLGAGLMAGAAAEWWARNNPDSVAVLVEAAKEISADRQYKSVIDKNMTPARHAIYEQVERGALYNDNGATCFTIPAGTNDADTKAVTAIIGAQETIIGNRPHVITRDKPAPGCHSLQ